MNSTNKIKSQRSASKKVSSGSAFRITKYSPSWVVSNPNGAPGYNLALIEKIRTGVTKKDWKELIWFIKANEKDFEKILPSSISSMQKKEVYNQETSERIYEISRLFGLGYEVFDSPEKFKNWLFTPSKALGDKKPFDFLDSSLGFNVVENEIIRIQYNVYS